jgi:hypothetical protein
MRRSEEGRVPRGREGVRGKYFRGDKEPYRELERWRTRNGEARVKTLVV